MNSERKAFIEAAKKIGINTAMVETPMGLQFKYGSTNDAFKIWQASAQRQGYKLVPVEPTQKMIESAIIERSKHGRTDSCIYKAMIGEVDD